ncbi:hypothetical protein K458DRAFT_45137 [Lentithecium fluviatile CBS 122367]|uniref:DUF4246 domain-containing protein n=1 Tax=Lentithecium fluviatile CBS 122367 TaxID=1168545 RepID=A0A6G1IYY3_9PLEO|nr:hypothetical protein K458DRAFT_45137 [Lentithecium fluviatile CBS 122367]
MFTYCIQEIRAKATLYEKFSIIPVFDASECILKSDSAIPHELKEELRSAVSRLEDVPENHKDWHPGSDGKVLDLVFPSLFPLVYGRSRILPSSIVDLESCLQNIGQGQIIPVPPDGGYAEYKSFFSICFQWLPCNVSFPDSSAQTDSYINNLHPRDHRGLYHVIEKIIDRAVPFWNIVCEIHYMGRIKMYSRIALPMADYTNETLGEDEMRKIKEDEENETTRIIDKGTPFVFDKLHLKSEDIEDKFAFLGGGERKVQVIVKLANIMLTPDKPNYDGGSWHIEGQLNEHIVSTAIYYYDNHNITDSRLQFQTKVDDEGLTMDGSYRHEDVDRHSLSEVFGLDMDTEFVMELGSILTREDRFIVFPNGFQHCVSPFKLADPTKPGHRKILAMFLVAPKDPVISTANVPPQRKDWWQREVGTNKGTRLGALPAELLDLVFEGVGEFPMSLQEAKKIRGELMKERSLMDQEIDDHLTYDTFNLCEH